MAVGCDHNQQMASIFAHSAGSGPPRLDGIRRAGEDRQHIYVLADVSNSANLCPVPPGGPRTDTMFDPG